MKRFFIVIVAVILLFFLFIYFYDYRSNKQESASDYSLSKKEINLIHDGDIILRHGFGIVSDFISKTYNKGLQISHCAIITKNAGTYNIIHSVSKSLSDFDGVQTQDLISFIRESKRNSVVVLRYKPKTDKSLSCISKRAKYYLDKRIPFDNSFDLDDSTEFYCTELLWKIFIDEFNDDIFPVESSGERDHLRMSTFFDTTRFQVIINHLPRLNQSI